MEAIFKAVDNLFSNEIAGIGIGVAGLIDREKGKPFKCDTDDDSDEYDR